MHVVSRISLTVKWVSVCFIMCSGGKSRIAAVRQGLNVWWFLRPVGFPIHFAGCPRWSFDTEGHATHPDLSICHCNLRTTVLRDVVRTVHTTWRKKRHSKRHLPHLNHTNTSYYPSISVILMCWIWRSYDQYPHIKKVTLSHVCSINGE